MKQKTGFEFKIQRAKWGPFNGLRLEAVDVGLRRETKTLAKVTAIVVEPDYPALLKGQLKPIAVDVVSPIIEVELESLKGLLESKKLEPTHIASTLPKPKVAMNKPKVKAKPQKAKITPSVKQPAKPKAIPVPKKNKPTKPLVKPKPNPKAAPKVEKEKIQGFPFKLRVSDVMVKTKLKGEQFLSLDRVSVVLPTGNRNGYVKVRKVQCRGKAISENVLMDLSLNHSGLVLNSQSLRVFDCPVKMHGSLSRRGVFQGETEVVLDKWATTKKWGEFSHAGIMGKCVFGGVLKQPRSWQSNWQILALGLSMSHPAKSVKFERSTLAGTLTSRGCDLKIVRFIGDELSVIGDGFLASNGEVDAKFRVSATEDAAKNVSRFTGGLRVHFPMQPMEAPDQFFNDVAVRGKLWDMEFKSSRRWKNLKKVLKSAKTFLKKEGEETLKGE